MNDQVELTKQAEKLIQLGEKVLETETTPSHKAPVVDDVKFHEFRISCLSYLSRVFGNKSTLYQNYKAEVTHSTPSRTRRGIGFLKSAVTELQGEWLTTTRGVISKDILSGFLRQARLQFDQGNFEAAVVIAGTVLDQILRNVCQNQDIKLFNEIQGKASAKKALQLSGEAYKKSLFDRNTNKSILVWIELFNDIAEKKERPKISSETNQMLSGIQSFLASANL